MDERGGLTPDDQQLIEFPDAKLEEKWRTLEDWLTTRFGRDTSIESILFVIGVQSRGIGFSPKLEKEDKQEMIMEGSCLALETIGHFQRIGMDEREHWIWERRVAVSGLTVDEQEKLLRIGILRYFEQFVETLQAP